MTNSFPTDHVLKLVPLSLFVPVPRPWHGGAGVEGAWRPDSFSRGEGPVRTPTSQPSCSVGVQGPPLESRLHRTLRPWRRLWAQRHVVGITPNLQGGVSSIGPF